MPVFAPPELNRGARILVPPSVGVVRGVWTDNGSGVGSFVRVAYADLTGAPNLGSAAYANVTSLLQVSNALSELAGVAAAARTNLGLATVAASGLYSDLSGKPDLTVYATLASPHLTGVPLTQTPATNDDSTQIANTSYVRSYVASLGYSTGVTLSGENYLSLTGQAITANPVNLSGTNVTGTLAAARFPAMTGDVTNTAGALATTVGAINGASLGSTAATAGNLLIGSGTAWVTRAVSGDGTLSSTGGLVVTKTNGVAFTSAATTALGTSGATIPLLSTANTWGGQQTFVNPIVGTQTVGDNSTLAASTAFVMTAINTFAAGDPDKAAADYVAVSALPANTYNNGSSGVGATITMNATGTLTIDGNVVALGNDIIVNGETTQANNGLYRVTTAGAIGVAAVLTRRTDYDTTGEVTAGNTVYVRSGTTYQRTTWTMISSGTITIGTTAIVWTQTAGVGTYVAGTGMTLTGSTFSVNASQTQVTGLGTVTTGTWNATAIGVPYGGTGLTTLTNHAVMLGQGTSNVAFASPGTAGGVLISQGASADPSFNAISGDITLSQAGVVAVTKINGVTLGTTTATSGNLLVGSGTDWVTKSMSGDATIDSNGAIVVTKTNGNAFAASAYTDTTSASNIGSGSLALARIAAIAAYSYLGNATGSAAVPAANTVLTLGVAPGFTPSAGTFCAQLTGTVSSYYQLIVQNKSSNAMASSDVVVTSDDGDDTTHYANFGINGSVGGSAPFPGPHAAYCYSVDAAMYVGALGTGGAVYLVAGGGTSTPATQVTISGTATTFANQIATAVNGALSTPSISITGAPATGGTGTTTVPLCYFNKGSSQPTGFSAGGTFLGINSANGWTGNYIDIWNNAALSLFKIDANGITYSVNFASAATGGFVFSGRSRTLSPSDGIIGFYNNGFSSFSRLQFGGTSSSFAGIGFSGTTTTFQLADGTSGGALVASGTFAVASTSTFSGNVTVSAVNLITDTTTGTKIGTATNQKLGFFNATPVVQQTGDIATALANLGLTAASPTLSAASLTSGTIPAGVGFSATDYSGGTISSGTYTPATTNGNQQYYTNNGAHTLAPPATSCTVIVLITNGVSAGAITTSGFTKVSGDSFVTTNTYKFLCYITRVNSITSLNVQAMQ